MASPPPANTRHTSPAATTAMTATARSAGYRRISIMSISPATASAAIMGRMRSAKIRHTRKQRTSAKTVTPPTCLRPSRLSITHRYLARVQAATMVSSQAARTRLTSARRSNAIPATTPIPGHLRTTATRHWHTSRSTTVATLTVQNVIPLMRRLLTIRRPDIDPNARVAMPTTTRQARTTTTA